MCFLKTNILCWTSRSWKGYQAKWKNRAFFAPNTLATVLGKREVQPTTEKGLLLCQSCRCLWPNIPMSFLRLSFYEMFLKCDLFFSSLCENEAFLLSLSFPVCVPNHMAAAVLASLYTQGLIVLWTSLVATVTRSNVVSDDCCVGCVVVDLDVLRQPVHWVIEKMVSPHCSHWWSVLKAFPGR